MKQRSILMAVALLISGWLAFFGSKPDGNDISEPVVRKSGNNAGASNQESTNKIANVPSTSTSTNARNNKAPIAIEVLALQDREMLFGDKPTPDAKAGTNLALTEPLFDSHNWSPPPPPPPTPGPPPPPMAPPLPFTILGKKLDDNNWEVYLARGEQTFIVREKTILEEVYRVESIRPPTMTLTYIPLNQTQTLTIGGID